jgi:hypothetical protein
MPIITIGSQVINFPNSSASPDWSPAIIQFAKAVSQILNTVSGAFDVPNQTFTIDIYNPGTNIDIPALAFPITQVRAASVNYSVFRQTSTTTAYETGIILAVYNPSNPPGSAWEFNIQRVGDAQITFNILDSGQVQFTTQTLTGINHVGKISFVASSLLKTN